ncbi:MAG TPA: HAD-IC family P-type ATPase, partial [Caldilineaceae bacterium]|nr:HAD-IC family P-type ATPase [Caldilineaceae bacterium]
LIESYGLAVDESALTGESAPVDKTATLPAAEVTPLAERKNMLYAGTLITRGRGKAMVVGTGMATELGRVAGMARGVKEPRTPLQEAMDEISRSLVWLAVAFSIVIPILGVLVARQPLETMILTGLSLAFATIPEEIPIIITMVLALGAYRLSKENAVVKHLKAVETLGAVTVIATDKTGTLTQNRMAVSDLFPPSNQQQLLVTGSLCNDTLVAGAQAVGDPLEIALVRAAEEAGIDQQASANAHPRVSEFPFDTVRQRMAVVTKDEHGYHVWVKGAPESILSIATHQQTGASVIALDGQTRQAMLAAAARMAERGLRVIAFGEKAVPAAPASQEEAESQLTFLGLAGLVDPPRAEVKGAIDLMQRAGIRTLMVTGDHPLTARAIAQAVGLADNGRVVTGPELDQLSEDEQERVVNEVAIFARTTPEHKLRIARFLQAQGQRVAVTGDGVNDAPALAVADIGVAMGETGSDVAREAEGLAGRGDDRV